MYRPRRFSRDRLLEVKQEIQASPLAKVMLGAGRRKWPGWIATDRDILDVRKHEDWNELFSCRRPAALLAEHVWEHLELEESECALRHCFEFLQTGGRLRIAVPDGYHPDPCYLDHVRPGGSGPSAEDHRVLYNHKTLTAVISQAGFAIDLLEFWDECHNFHHQPWNWEHGPVKRSSRYDIRNRDGKPHFTSLIIDAFKP